jgi:hypothetical protein
MSSAEVLGTISLVVAMSAGGLAITAWTYALLLRDMIRRLDLIVLEQLKGERQTVREKP